MNPYQAKLEKIKSKRLSPKVRLQSFFIFIGLAFTALFIVPALGLRWTFQFYEYLINSSAAEWVYYLAFGASVLIGLSVLYLIFKLAGLALKHLVRMLSGIKEDTKT